MTRIKTTIEISNELLAQVRGVIRKEGITLRRLVEEGLQRSLEVRRRKVPQCLDFPTFGGSGLTSEFRGASWNRIRDEVYREHGA